MKVVAGTCNTRSLRNGTGDPGNSESPGLLVAGGRNTRFLRLVEQAIPRLVAWFERCPPKACVKPAYRATIWMKRCLTLIVARQAGWCEK
jgi:hypothetical protein